MNIITRDTILLPADGLVVEDLDDGSVIWDPKGQRLHLLDVPGREIWRRLRAGAALAQVWTEAADAFGISPEVVRRDSTPFLADLVTSELLVQT